MVRTKNYQANPVRREQFRDTGEADGGALIESGDARIDMVALLGVEARFASNEKNIDFNGWLNCGIDIWVWTVLACFRALLLSGTRQPSTVAQYAKSFRIFFAFLTEGREGSRIATPVELSPLHIDAFIGWLQARQQKRVQTTETIRTCFKNVKSVLLEMFAQGYVHGEPTRFFKKRALPWREGESRQSSLSDAEQERLASAIKADLIAIHHGRLMLSQGDIQALRLLLVAHRQGTNPAPLLELQRDAMAPGLLPGTIRMRTTKIRGRKVRSGVGRAASQKSNSGSESTEASADNLIFALAEGAMLQQAIATTETLVQDAAVQLKSRVWLYRSQGNGRSKGGAVTCLTSRTLGIAIHALIERHRLLGDDGERLRLNLSRLRKSYFERALRNSDGDLAKTANLMGNTPSVAALNYPSMNEARKAVAAEFMNGDYINLMRADAGVSGETRAEMRVVMVKPVKTNPDGSPVVPLERTPVSNCKDSLNGEHAPRNGQTHCDRYVMCLFCSSFAIVGTTDELWRLFSFQVFAKAELEYLDATLGYERTDDDALEDLRDRYRIAVPFIDGFTERQFPARTVKAARSKVENNLHPFWVHQMTMSRRARFRALETEG